MVVSEIGNYRLTREAITETHHWEKPGAGRFDTPRENFYPDIVCMPMSEKTIGFTVDEKRPGVYPILYTYHEIKKFSAAQVDEAIEFFRAMVNGDLKYE